MYLCISVCISVCIRLYLCLYLMHQKSFSLEIAQNVEKTSFPTNSFFVCISVLFTLMASVCISVSRDSRQIMIIITNAYRLF